MNKETVNKSGYLSTPIAATCKRHAILVPLIYGHLPSGFTSTTDDVAAVRIWTLPPHRVRPSEGRDLTTWVDSSRQQTNPSVHLCYVCNCFITWNS